MQVIEREYTFLRRYWPHSPISTKSATCTHLPSMSGFRSSIQLLGILERMFTTVRLGSEFYNSECRRQGGRWRSRTELVSEGGSSRRGSRDRRSSRSSVELTAIRNSTGRGQGGEEAAALLAGAARRGDGGGWRRAVDSEGERTAEGFGSSARITVRKDSRDRRDLIDPFFFPTQRQNPPNPKP